MPVTGTNHAGRILWERPGSFTMIRVEDCGTGTSGRKVERPRPSFDSDSRDCRGKLSVSRPNVAVFHASRFQPGFVPLRASGCCRFPKPSSGRGIPIPRSLPGGMVVAAERFRAAA